MRKHYTNIIEELDLLIVLAVYEPTVIGTPPLKIDIETSDIDIACTAENLTDFISAATLAYSNHTKFFSEYFQTREEPATRCLFNFYGWEIELFCQVKPIAKQWGVRHFKVEKKLLQLDSGLRSHVIQLKQSGLKTEAAFASILKLQGDPFEAVLELEAFSTADLIDLISKALPRPAV